MPAENIPTDLQLDETVATSKNDVLPDVPLLAVRIMWEECMIDHINNSSGITELYFSVIDNEGVGDCFYEVIINSTVFQREYPEYRTNVQMLRTDIQNYAKANERGFEFGDP